MTEEEVLFEGRVAGIDFWDIYNWTWGEIRDFVLVYNERERRKNQERSIIAFIHARLAAQMIFSDSKENLYVQNEFPFWTEDEQREMRIARLRQTIESHAKKPQEATKHG